MLLTLSKSLPDSTTVNTTVVDTTLKILLLMQCFWRSGSTDIELCAVQLLISYSISQGHVEGLKDEIFDYARERDSYFPSRALLKYHKTKVLGQKYYNKIGTSSRSIVVGTFFCRWNHGRHHISSLIMLLILRVKLRYVGSHFNFSVCCCCYCTWWTITENKSIRDAREVLLYRYKTIAMQYCCLCSILVLFLHQACFTLCVHTIKKCLRFDVENIENVENINADGTRKVRSYSNIYCPECYHINSSMIRYY